MEIWPGRAYPLGATFDGSGTNFALFSEVAERVELCLFDDRAASRDPGRADRGRRLRLALLPAAVQPGQRYGYRVHGPWDPEQGLRCNPNKLLLDPYAKATTGEIDWDQSLFGYNFGDEDSRNDDDSGRAHDPRRGDQPVLRLGGRPPARRPLQRVGHLRGPRQGADPAAPGRARGAARHLRRPRAPRGHRPPQAARRHRDRADAGAPVHPGQHPARQGAAQLLGLQHPRASSPRTRRTPPAAADSQASPASRCRSSSRW